MPKVVILPMILCVITVNGCSKAAPTESRPDRVDRDDLVYPGEQWSRLPSLSAAGWDEKLLAQARQFSESIGSHAVMIVDRGRVVAEWGATAEEIVVQSIRKSVLNA